MVFRLLSLLVSTLDGCGIGGKSVSLKLKYHIIKTRLWKLNIISCYMGISVRHDSTDGSYSDGKTLGFTYYC